MGSSLMLLHLCPDIVLTFMRLSYRAIMQLRGKSDTQNMSCWTGRGHVGKYI